MEGLEALIVKTFLVCDGLGGGDREEGDFWWFLIWLKCFWYLDRWFRWVFSTWWSNFIYCWSVERKAECKNNWLEWIFLHFDFLSNYCNYNFWLKVTKFSFQELDRISKCYFKFKRLLINWSGFNCNSWREHWYTKTYVWDR
jgi:hypothetical protein